MIAVPSGSAAHQASTSPCSYRTSSAATASATGARHRLWSLNRGAKAGEALASINTVPKLALAAVTGFAPNLCSLGAPFFVVGVRSNPEAPSALPLRTTWPASLGGEPCWIVAITGNPESLWIGGCSCHDRVLSNKLLRRH